MLQVLFLRFSNKTTSCIMLIDFQVYCNYCTSSHPCISPVSVADCTDKGENICDKCFSKVRSSRSTMNSRMATKHFRLSKAWTLDSISFSSPLHAMDLEFYLFIYLFASMWSKRLMKQQAVCHLCRNNYMEMVFTGHCVAPEQSALNWQRWSERQQWE